MLSTIRTFIAGDDGASAVEYGLIVGLVAVAIVGVVTTLGTTLQGLFQNIVTKLSAIPTT